MPYFHLFKIICFLSCWTLLCWIFFSGDNNIFNEVNSKTCFILKKVKVAVFLWINFEQARLGFGAPCQHPWARLQVPHVQQHPHHRLLQDPVEAQSYEVHHMDVQLPFVARLPCDLCGTWPRGAGEGTEASFSSHLDNSQVV